jgi:hypothetical protein
MLAFDFTAWYAWIAYIAAAYLFWTAVAEKGHQHLRWLAKRFRRPDSAAGADRSSTTDEAEVSPASFDFFFETEAIDGGILANERVFLENVTVWLVVHNDGPTADFTARAWDIAGVPESWQPYALRQVVWEGTNSSRAEIEGYGGEKRLALANVAREPRAFWFNTTQLGSPMAGNQDLLYERVSTTVDHEYDFTLEVVNLASGVKRSERARLVLPGGGQMPICEFSDEATIPA